MVTIEIFATQTVEDREYAYAHMGDPADLPELGFDEVDDGGLGL